MDKQFLNAVIHGSHSFAGMDLRPLAFRHLLVLDLVGNPLFGALVDPGVIARMNYDECFKAAVVLSCGSDKALGERTGDPSGPLKEWLAARYAEGLTVADESKEALVEYWADMWSPPRVRKRQPAPKGMRLVRSNLPWIHHEICTLMALGGMSREVAWWSNASEGMWEALAFKEIARGRQASLITDAEVKEYLEMGWTPEQVESL